VKIDGTGNVSRVHLWLLYQPPRIHHEAKYQGVVAEGKDNVPCADEPIMLLA
jgi:hypothetical protein